MPGAYEKVMQSRKALVEKIIRNMEHGDQDPRWMTFRQFAENGYCLRPAAGGKGYRCLICSEKVVYRK